MRSKNRYEWYKYVVIKKQYEHFIVTHKHVMKKKSLKKPLYTSFTYQT